MSLHKIAWTFLTNHAMVLLMVWQHSDLTVRAIAERIGITERATHRILAALVGAGYLTRKRVGRGNHYQVNEDRLMRHPLTRHRKVGQFLRVVGGKEPPPAGGS